MVNEQIASHLYMNERLRPIIQVLLNAILCSACEVRSLNSKNNEIIAIVVRNAQISYICALS